MIARIVLQLCNTRAGFSARRFVRQEIAFQGIRQEVGRRMRKFLVGLLLIVAGVAIGLAIWEPLAARAPAAPAFKPADVQIARDGFGVPHIFGKTDADARSDEHTSEIQSPMRITYAVYCLKKNTTIKKE